MNIGALLKPIDDSEISGPNLEYESAFTEMEIASQYGEESQVGDVIREAEEPDFSELARAAQTVLEQSHDVRAAILLGEAALHTAGLAAFGEVTGLIRGYVEEYWDTFHPQLDEDDGDPTMRVNAVQGLADGSRLIRALRRSPLVNSRIFGPVSLRDIEIADGEISVPDGMDSPPDSASVSAAFQDGDNEQLAANLAAVEKSLEDVQAIDDAFSAQTPGQGPQLDPLIEVLKDIKAGIQRFADFGDDEESGGDDQGDQDGEDGEAPVRSGGGGGSGAINSRADVNAALDRILTYYERHEPSSPLPLLLRRAKRLVGADFMTIIRDIAQSSVDEVMTLGGTADDE